MAQADELRALRHPQWTTRLEGIIEIFESWIIVRSRRSGRYAYYLSASRYDKSRKQIFFEPMEYLSIFLCHSYINGHRFVIIFTRWFDRCGFQLKIRAISPLFFPMHVQRGSIVYRDKRSASPSKRKKEEKKRKGEKKKVALQVKEPSCLEVNEVACLSRLYDLLSRQLLPKYLCLIPRNFELSIRQNWVWTRTWTRWHRSPFFRKFSRSKRRLTFQFVQRHA